MKKIIYINTLLALITFSSILTLSASSSSKATYIKTICIFIIIRLVLGIYFAKNSYKMLIKEFAVDTSIHSRKFYTYLTLIIVLILALSDYMTYFELSKSSNAASILFFVSGPLIIVTLYSLMFIKNFWIKLSKVKTIVMLIICFIINCIIFYAFFFMAFYFYIQIHGYT